MIVARILQFGSLLVLARVLRWMHEPAQIAIPLLVAVSLVWLAWFLAIRRDA